MRPLERGPSTSNLASIQTAMARAQQQAGLVTQAQIDDLVAHKDTVDREQPRPSKKRFDMM